MKLITWNVRAMNKVYKQKELKLFIKENNVNIIVILENRVQEKNATGVIRKITWGSEWKTNYYSSNRGRIWVLWDPMKLDFTVTIATEQVIHETMKCSVLDIKFHFTATYGLHTVEDRKSLWRQLSNIETGLQGPWLIMGDLNAVLNPDDRLNGSMVTEAETRDFRDFIVDTGLCELKTVGRDFTWTNSHVFSRIDRALVNAEWMTNFTQLEVEVMDPRFSDHSPLCIDLWRQLTGSLDLSNF